MLQYQVIFFRLQIASSVLCHVMPCHVIVLFVCLCLCSPHAQTFKPKIFGIIFCKCHLCDISVFFLPIIFCISTNLGILTKIQISPCLQSPPLDRVAAVFRIFSVLLCIPGHFGLEELSSNNIVFFIVYFPKFWSSLY